MRVSEKYIQRTAGDALPAGLLQYELELNTNSNPDPGFASAFGNVQQSVDRKGRITVYLPPEDMKGRAKKVREDKLADCYDAVINFKVVDAAGKIGPKALNVNYLWIDDSKYQRLGLGSLLIHEIASICLSDYKDVKRFEIDSAVEDAFGFYFKLGLHVSSVFSTGQYIEVPPALHPVPRVSQESLNAMAQHTPWAPRDTPKFEKTALDSFRNSLKERMDWRNDMAGRLLENSVENILHTSKIQAIRAGWII